MWIPHYRYPYGIKKEKDDTSPILVHAQPQHRLSCGVGPPSTTTPILFVYTRLLLWSLQVKWKICQSISAVHYPIRHENMNLKEQSFFQQKMRNPQSMCVPLSSQMGHLVLKKAWTTIKKLLWNQKPARKVYSLISIGSGQGNLTSTDFGILVAVGFFGLTSMTQLWHVLLTL